MHSRMEPARSDESVYLAAAGGFFALLDTIWGVIAVVAFFDWTRPFGVALGVALLACLPAYVLDYLSKQRVVMVLPLVFLFRYIVAVFAASPPAVGLPWTGNLLFIAAAILLQLSKRRKGEPLPGAVSRPK